MKPKHLGFLSVSKCICVSARPTAVIDMNGNKIKRTSNNNSLNMLDWMLAIDFDPIEVRLTRKDVF
jgi:hypothetical protein